MDDSTKTVYLKQVANDYPDTRSAKFANQMLKNMKKISKPDTKNKED